MTSHIQNLLANQNAFLILIDLSFLFLFLQHHSIFLCPAARLARLMAQFIICIHFCKGTQKQTKLSSIGKSQVMRSQQNRAYFGLTTHLKQRLQIFMFALLLFILLQLAIACPDHCYNCFGGSPFCLACQEGYQLSLMSTCISDNFVPNCAYYANNTHCNNCQPTFTFINNTCIKAYSGCTSSNPSTGVCFRCDFGTELINGSCVGSLKCLNVSQKCGQCQSGWTLQSGKCMDSTGNCSILSNQGVCQTCKDGFKLIGYQCVPQNIKVENCYIYNSGGNCTFCKDGFTFYESQCLVSQQISKIFNGQLTLADILKNRTIEASNSQSSLTVLNNNSSRGQLAIFSRIPNCQAVNPLNALQCTKCSKNYILVNSGCLYVSPYCAAYDPSTGICYLCKANYKLSNGNCVDENCQTLLNERCSICKVGYLPNSEGLCQQQIQYCNIVQGNKCQECYSGYFVTIEGKCEQLPVNCLYANMETKKCMVCLDGFQLSQQKQCFTPIAHCIQQNSSSVCLTCEQGYYPQGTYCLKVSPYCSSYTPSTGTCIACMGGLTIINNNCFDSNCNNLQDGLCISCVSGYYLSGSPAVCKAYPSNCLSVNSNGICVQCTNGYSLNQGSCVAANNIANCQVYSNIMGRCTACLPGYSLTTNYTCQIQSSQTYKDINCLSFQGNICLNCSNRFYFSLNNGKCIPVNPQCKDYSPTDGSCTTCYPGYYLQSGSCLITLPTVSNCMKQNSNGLCQQCYSGFYLNNGVCKQLNPLCKTSNLTTGDCLSCYPGYSLINGQCSIYLGDPNCFKSNSSGFCLNCSKGFYVNSNGRCIQVSPLCKGSDANGRCLDCYPGYTLSFGSCTIGFSIQNTNCQKSTNGVCEQCYNGFYLNYNKECAQANPLCKTYHNLTGVCLSCYPGYSLSQGSCKITSGSSSSQSNCAKTDSNSVCTACFSGYFLTASKSCQKVSDLCKTYSNSTGLCTSCFEGYSLSFDGGCLISSQSNNPTQKDPYCIESFNNYCSKCVSGYYLDNSETCALANPLCKEVDSSNNCTSCYQGYNLINGNCLVITISNIVFCLIQNGNVCTECMQGYYLNQKQCLPVSILCKSYNKATGACLSCIEGYVYQNQECIRPSLGVDPNCELYSGSFCSQCKVGYKLISYWCTMADSNCLQYQPITGNCLVCRNNLKPSSSSCI